MHRFKRVVALLLLCMLMVTLMPVAQLANADVAQEPSIAETQPTTTENDATTSTVSSEPETEPEAETTPVTAPELESDSETEPQIEIFTSAPTKSDTTTVTTPPMEKVALGMETKKAVFQFHAFQNEKASFTIKEAELDDTTAQDLCQTLEASNVLDYYVADIETTNLYGPGTLDIQFLEDISVVTLKSTYVCLIRDGVVTVVKDFSAQVENDCIKQLSVPISDNIGSLRLVLLTGDEPSISGGNSSPYMTVNAYYTPYPGIGNSSTGALTYHWFWSDGWAPGYCLNSNKKWGGYDTLIAGTDEYIFENDTSPNSSWCRLSLYQRNQIKLALLYGCRSGTGGIWDSDWGITTSTPTGGFAQHPNPNAQAFAATQLIVWEICNEVEAGTYVSRYFSKVQDWADQIRSDMASNPKKYDLDETLFYIGWSDSSSEQGIMMVHEDAIAYQKSTGNLTVTKTISGTGSVANWRMELYASQSAANSGSGYQAYAYTNSSGVATFSNLSQGTYYVREAPASRQDKVTTTGWTLSTSVLSGTVVADTTTSVGTITNTSPRGGITVRKGLSSTNTSGKLNGWVFQVSTNSSFTNIVKTVTTDASGYAYTGLVLTPGIYYVREAPLASQTRSDKSQYTLDNSIVTVTVGTNVSVLANNGSGYTAVNTELCKIVLKKTIKASDECIAQIKGNALYTLAGAEYGIYLNGVYQETLTTDANGSATSSKSYPSGTTLTVKELKAPSAYKLDTTVYTVTTTSGNATVTVSDEPLFDPPFVLTKMDKNTTGAQGDATFQGAIFRWEYYDNYTWSGTAKRTWYFQSDAIGRAWYQSNYLAPGYKSDDLYVTPGGTNEIPLGSLQITEIKNPLGYTVLPQPLKCQIVVDASSAYGAKYVWDAASLAIMTDFANGNFGVEEPIDEALFGSVKIKKVDSLTGVALADAVFEIINNSTNAVQVGDYAVAQPGEVCYELTTGEDGVADSGAIFPLGKYTVQEKEAPAGYMLNTSWTKEFSVTETTRDFDFTDDPCADRPAQGGIRIEKMAKNSSGETITAADTAGIRFAVLNQEKTVAVLTLNYENGVAFVQTGEYDFPFGTYTVRELPAITGGNYANDYYLCAKDQTITIDGEHLMPSLTFVDELRPGKISVQKIDDEGYPLANAKFQLLYRTSENSAWQVVGTKEATTTAQIDGDGCLITGETGVIEFTGLDPHWEYKLLEVDAPDGYQLLTRAAYEGKLPSDTVEVSLRVVNARIFQIPKTGGIGFGPWVLLIAGLYALSLSLAVLAFRKRNIA